MSKSKVKSSDVAKAAGVSRATVSYVLNNVEGARISEETRKRVIDTASRLGYHVDFIAQALKTKRSMTIGVVSRRSISEDRFSKVLAGVKDVLSKEHYSILLCSDDIAGNGYPEYYNLYHSKKIDGVIFISYQEQLKIEPVTEHVDLAIKDRMPTVFIDYHINNEMVNCVDIDYYHNACIATDYLIKKGYKNIGLLIPDIEVEQERQRLTGVVDTIDKVDDVKLYTFYAGKNDEQFKKDIIRTLEHREPLDAIIVSWNYLACYLLYYTNKLKIDVPGELAVMALAGGSSVVYTYPQLSTCDLPLYESGVRSAHIILETMRNKSVNPVNTKLPCQLRIRDSC